MAAKYPARPSALADTETTSFIEENHQYKQASRREQDSQPWKGPIPQEVMSFWGTCHSLILRASELMLNAFPSGYKFETLSTMPAPWGDTSREYIEGRDNEIVNNKEQYCSVVRTGLGKS